MINYKQTIIVVLSLISFSCSTPKTNTDKESDNNDSIPVVIPPTVKPDSIADVKFEVGSLSELGYMGNGIIPNMGVNDPHIHIFNNKAYLFASHDTIIGSGNTDYTMPNWNIYSSQDLVNWKKEFVLHPEDTYIGKAMDKCFATDGATRNGKYYFYFSNFNINTGVAVSDKPEGPYIDMGKPILPETLGDSWQKKYDPTIFIDDDGKHYIVWGYTGWGTYYQIAELNDDMISIKTTPKDLKMADDSKMENDANYLHKHNGIYYINSHHGKYASSKNLYGPYEYRGELEASGDHGTFFKWNNQTYYAAGGWQASYFRHTYLCYAHYKDNGEIVAKREIKGNYEQGVGRYNCNLDAIEAECYFAASDSMVKKQNTSGFEMQNITHGSYLFYPRVFNINENTKIEFTVSNGNTEKAIIEVREGGTYGKLIASCEVAPTASWNTYTKVSAELNYTDSAANIYLLFKGGKGDILHLDKFTITEK